MPGFNPIGLGNQPDDGLGDGGRSGGAKLNAMLDEIFYTSFVKDDQWHVTRRTVTGGVLTGTQQVDWKLDDHVKGWVDPDTRTHWLEGIVLDPTIVLPDDRENTAKFFKTNEKVSVT